MRGDPVPRGGERQQPNPLFLAHAAALSELYVTLATGAGKPGLSLYGYAREGEAREPFEYLGAKHALAPDALVTFADGDRRELLAFVEVDLGTMSHARLRQKAELYGAYAAAGAWRGRHRFQPGLLFLTTTDVRAARFLRALSRTLSYGKRSPGRRPFVAGAGGVVWWPSRLVEEKCLADLDGHDGLTLQEVLYAARAPYERQLAEELQQQQAREEKRRRLFEDPDALREHLRRHRRSLEAYARELGDSGETAFDFLVDSTGRLLPNELGVLRAVAHDLGEALPEPGMHRLQPPRDTVRGETRLLIETYRAAQGEQLRALAARHGQGPHLQKAVEALRSGGLIDRQTFKQLPYDAQRDKQSRHQQTECRVAYEASRETQARDLARKAGPLGRLTHRPEDFYAQLDERQLRVCGRCDEVVYPRSDASWNRYEPACHYCHGTGRVAAYATNQPASHEGRQR